MLRKAIFCHKIISFSLRELKFLGKMYFSYNERFASAKVGKVFLVQRHNKKVIFYISGI